MAIDYCLGFECAAKLHFGNGDSVAGSTEILERLKAGSRGRMLTKMAREEGKDPHKVSLTVYAADPNGMQVQKEVTLADLEAQASVLDAHTAACATCPANCIGGAFGCFGCIHYPISAQAENWFLDRVQPSGTVGAEMCFDIVTKLGVNGQQAARMRQSGMFEATNAKRVTLKKAIFSSQSITADQLFESVFMVDNPFSPDHCLGVLVWFGAVTVDGRVLTDPNDLEGLAKLVSLKTPEAKAQFTQQVLGPPSDSEEIAAFESYFRAMYLAWFYDLPLHVSA